MNAKAKTRLAMAIGAVALAIAGAIAWMFGPALFAPEGINVGIARGEKAPMTLPMRDASAQPVTLGALTGERGLVVLLVRSADWCPFCKMQLRRAQALETPLAERGYALVSLSYDPPEKLKPFAEAGQIAYPMLSDPGHRFVDAVGLRDPQYPQGHFAYGVPRASVLVLAPDGTVQAKFVSENYKQRPSNAAVLALVDGARD